MINQNLLQDILPPAIDAFSTFLETLLEKAPAIQHDEPTLSPKPETIPEDSFLVLGEHPVVPVVVLLSKQWIGLFSQAMLGEEITELDETTIDLVQELAAQAYGAIRNQIATPERDPGQITFRVADETALQEIEWTENTYSLSLSVTVNESPYPLTVYLIAPPIPEEDPETLEESADTDSPDTATAEPTIEVAPAAFENFASSTTSSKDGGTLPENFELLVDVELEITVELGRRRMPLADILRMTTGTVVELEKLAGEPLDVYANGRLIAQGEAVVIDEQFGVRITRLAPSRTQERAFL